MNDNILRFLIVYVILAQAKGLSYSTNALIAVSGALFILPFLLFSPYAGQWADCWSKRDVLLFCKAWEIPVMVVAAWGLVDQNLVLLMIALFLAGIQAAFFGPAKYGIIPELVPITALNRANALIGASTFLGILMGAVIGGWLFDLEGIWLQGVIPVIVAMFGLGCALAIGRTSRPSHPARFHLNFLAEAFHDLRQMYCYRTVFISALLISYLWFLGAMLQLLIPQIGTQTLGLSGTLTQSLLVMAAVGIILGCSMAGFISGKNIRVGLSKIGLIGMGIGTLCLGGGGSTYVGALAGLFCAGFSGGLFIVPLYALLQQQSPAAERGRMIAANNILNTVALLLASFFLYLLGDLAHLSAIGICLTAGLLTLLLGLWMVRLEIAPAKSVPLNDVPDQIAISNE